MQAAGKKYDIALISSHENRSRVQIEVKLGKETIYRWGGHPTSVFAIENDRLYYADYWIANAGGSVIAVNLKTGKTLWKSALQGMNVPHHFHYRTSLNLKLSRGAVIINARETYGTYRESFDIQSGKRAEHKVIWRLKK